MLPVIGKASRDDTTMRKRWGSVFAGAIVLTPNAQRRSVGAAAKAGGVVPVRAIVGGGAVAAAFAVDAGVDVEAAAKRAVRIARPLVQVAHQVEVGAGVVDAAGVVSGCVNGVVLSSAVPVIRNLWPSRAMS